MRVDGSSMEQAESIARIQNAVKRYADFTAVDGVSLEIQRGEIFGLLGPNGAGKTTLISMLAGLLPLTGGAIEVAGQDAGRASLAVKRAIGIAPQELAIYPRLTARENLTFFGQLYGLRDGDLKTRADAMLSLVGLTDRADSRAETYSGGMKRRLNLAAALMHRPQLLLLDEPTVGVDPQSRNHIFEGVRALNRQGLTVLYTSHYMEEVEALCDRVGIMDGGKLIACDTLPNLIARLGGAMIEVGLDSRSAADPLLTSLRGISGVASAALAPRSETDRSELAVLQVRAAQPHRVLPGIVAALNAADAPLLSLQIKNPNLEDVFLSLTGKNLRD